MQQSSNAINSPFGGLKGADIIIIGAGFAGVAAARECSQNGYSVLLLEAKDRIGGRTWTSEFSEAQVEMGGGYVFWTQPHVWAEINRYGLHLKERAHYAATTAMLKTRFLIGNEVHDKFSETETAQIKAAFQDFVAEATNVFPQPFQPDIFTEDCLKYDKISNLERINAMQLTDLQRAMLIRTAAIQCHNAAEEGSFAEALRWFALANGDTDTYAHSLSRFTLKEGTAHLLQCMLNDAKNTTVELNCAVERIEQTENEVTIFTKNNTFKAKKCIVATSINIWKNIDFSPQLSEEKRQFSQEEHAGKGAKVLIAIEGAFKDSRWSAIDEPFLSILPHIVDNQRSILVTFTNPAVPMELNKENIQAFLQRFDANVKVLDFIYHDWTNDPHTLGTWCTLRPNQMTNYLTKAQQPEGNVYFAGADIARGWRGFIDGAIESGIRVAKNAVESGKLKVEN